MKGKCSYFIILLPISVLTQGSWEWQNPLPQGVDISGICPVAEEKVIAVGTGNTVLITHDEGQSWQIQKLSDKFGAINALSFSDSLNGWVWGLFNVFKTEDGGITWNEKDLGVDLASNRLYGIGFMDNQTGYFLINPKLDLDESYMDHPGRLHKTIDGGETWFEVETGIKGKLVNVYFKDSLNGFLLSVEERLGNDFIYSIGLLYRTYDGGNTWEKLPDPEPGYLGGFSGIEFVTPEVGWSGWYQTTDGGNTWEYIPHHFPEGIEYIYGRVFVDTLTGWAYNYKTILKTEDGAKNWFIQKVTKHGILSGISFYNRDIGWVCGDGGTIYKTTDAGENWIRMGKGTTDNLYDVDFVDSETGWVVGLNGTILHTANGGKTWKQQESNVEDFLSAVDFANENNGWAVGKGYILNTKNGGGKWVMQYQHDLGNGYFRDVQFLDQSTGFVVGGRGFLGWDGVLLRTRDGGETWEHLEGYNFPTLAAISFVDKQYGWICGAGGTMFATQDGGETWQKQDVAGSPPPFLRALQFVDRNHGWTSSGDDEAFFRTTDGGSTWQQVPSGYFNMVGIHSFFFLNPDTGWASSFMEGYIAKTLNGGQTWEIQDILPPFRIYSLCFMNSCLGWAVGTHGAILRYTDSHSSTTSPTIHIPGTFRIGSFPNPFNSGTNIYFTVSRRQKAKVSIFNGLGQRVEDLYDGIAGEGINMISWEAKGFPSGTYFIRVQCEEYSQSSLCTLLK